jgi:hypothetical protein
MLVRVESSNPGEARPSRRFSGRGLFITLFALLIAGSAALVATGAAGAGSADGASAASSASQAGLSLSAMTTQQALQAVLGSGAAPPSAGAAPVSGIAPPCARARWLRHHHPGPRAAAPARHPAAARGLRRHCRRLAVLRLLAGGVHGQLTYRTSRGFATLAFERGTIASVSGTTVTVTAADGTTWTWHLLSSTVIRRGGRRVTAAALARGQRVLAVGPVLSGQNEARLIRVATVAAPS